MEKTFVSAEPVQTETDKGRSDGAVRMSGGFFYGAGSDDARGDMAGPFDRAAFAEAGARALSASEISDRYAGPWPHADGKPAATLSETAIEQGMDPLEVIRHASAKGLLAEDDPRQLAAAATHPDPEMQIALPVGMRKSLQDISGDRSASAPDRETRMKAIALQQMSVGKTPKASVVRQMELEGMALVKQGQQDLAMGYFSNAMSIAREEVLQNERTPKLRGDAEKAEAR